MSGIREEKRQNDIGVFVDAACEVLSEGGDVDVVVLCERTGLARKRFYSLFGSADGVLPAIGASVVRRAMMACSDAGRVDRAGLQRWFDLRLGEARGLLLAIAGGQSLLDLKAAVPLSDPSTVAEIAMYKALEGRS